MRSDSAKSRVCTSRNESVWYPRYYAVAAVDCTVCGRTFYGRHDITEQIRMVGNR